MRKRYALLETSLTIGQTSRFKNVYVVHYLMFSPPLKALVSLHLLIGDRYGVKLLRSGSRSGIRGREQVSGASCRFPGEDSYVFRCCIVLGRFRDRVEWG